MPDFSPFPVELGEIQVFPTTDVIYVSVKAGFMELKGLHAALCGGCLSFKEPFRYHPHVTLAQELTRQQLGPARDTAMRRWNEFRGSRTFVVNKLTFVQNTPDNCWTDLNSWQLSTSVPSL